MKELEKKPRKVWPWILAVCAVIAIVAAAVCLHGSGTRGGSEAEISDEIREIGQGLQLVSAGAYSGPYVEDGSDEEVKDILSITVKNAGTEPIQLATVTLTTATGETYSFTLTALPAGEQAMLLESSRAAYAEGLEIADTAVSGVALFNEPLSLHEELLEISAADQALTVKNVSGNSFAGGRIFYKTVSGDSYLGGITYMATVPAMEIDEEVTLYAGHYTSGSSRLMFVTYAG